VLFHLRDEVVGEIDVSLWHGASHQSWGHLNL